jgi:hypothetical protein
MSEMNALDERRDRLPAFEHVIYQHAICEFSIGLFRGNLDDAIHRLYVPGASIQLSPPLTPFYFLFFGLMETMSRWLQAAQQNIITEPVECFFDNSGEKEHIWKNWFDYMKAHPYIQNVFASTPRFEDDQKFLPLQAADYLAWQFRSAMQTETVNTNWCPSKPLDFPTIIFHLDEKALTAIYYRILSSTFPDAQILDAKSAISASELADILLRAPIIRTNAPAKEGEK